MALKRAGIARELIPQPEPANTSPWLCGSCGSLAPPLAGRGERRFDLGVPLSPAVLHGIAEAARQMQLRYYTAADGLAADHIDCIAPDPGDSSGSARRKG